MTIKAERPTHGLVAPVILEALTAQRFRLETDQWWSVRTWVVMPDHLHVVFVLGPDAALADCVRRFKGPLTPLLRRVGLRWQAGYYEHRMRAEEDRLPVFLYIFLNPYRKKLLALDQKWPGYYCSEADRMWFGPLTNAETPFPEWLA